MSIMSCSTKRKIVLTLALAMLCGLASAITPEAGFLAENDTAMSKMMSDMTIKPLGDVDRDFVAMMVPHHQGAIDMAQSELRYGRNELLRRIAQEIIVGQQQEIAAMRLALGEPLPPSLPSPTAPPPGQPVTSNGMMAMPSPVVQPK
jgi:hypothetical protein